MRVAPDDEVYRVNTVWLGPRGLTFPWAARYLAYAVWLLTFLVVLAFEGVTPLHVGVPPVWEISITTLFTYAVMGFVDHERPLSSVWQTFVADLRAPRHAGPRTTVTATRRVRIMQSRGEGRETGVPGLSRAIHAATSRDRQAG
jgi:hypothetical protein